MKKIYICGLTFILAWVISISSFASGVALDEASYYAIKKDEDLKILKKEVTKKNMELNQARHAIRDQRKKDSSLFSKDHNLDKDITLSMKVPKAIMNLRFAEFAVENKKRQIERNISLKYYDADFAKYMYERAKKERDLAFLNYNTKKNMLNEKEIKPFLELLTEAEGTLKSQKEALEAQIAEIEDMTGLNYDVSDDFYVKDYDMWFSEGIKTALVNYTILTNYEYGKIRDTKNMQQAQVNVIRALYTRELKVSAMNSINNMYNSNQDMDYDEFMNNYERMLNEVIRKWKGFFFIPFFFIPFIIPIPKFLLQDEYEGIRYFEDIKYALPVQSLELDKMIIEDREAKKRLKQSIETKYDDSLSKKNAYDLAFFNYQKADAEYRAYKSADKSEKEIEDKKIEKDEKELEMKQSRVEYNKSIIELSYESSGFVNLLLKNLIDYKMYLKLPEESATVKGIWKVNQKAEGVTSEFGIELEKADFKPTHYKVKTSDGKYIGEKTQLSKTVIHLNAIFSDVSKLQVEFYDGDKVIGSGTLEGYGSQGILFANKR